MPQVNTTVILLVEVNVYKNELAEQREVFNLRQAANFLGVSKPTMSRLLPQVPHRRAGKRVLISKQALEQWLEAKE